MNKKMSDEEREVVRRMYLEEGKTRGEVAEFLGVRYNTVGHFLEKAGCYGAGESRKDAIRLRHKGNRVFFERDSPDSVYLLGLIVTDGNINERRGYKTVRFYSSDRDMAEWVAEKLGGNLSKRTYATHKPGWEVGTSDVGVVKYFVDRGVKPRKSREGAERIVVNPLYEQSYLLGVLDGDGCVVKINKGTTLRVDWYGSEPVIGQVVEILSRAGFITKLRVRKDGIYHATLATIGVMPDLMRWLYGGGASFYLARKKRVFEEVLSFRSENES